MTTTATASWFCLRTEGRREHIAALNLAQRTSIEAFAPRIRLRRERRNGGVNTRMEALFPGYVFARFRYPDQVRHVLSTTGVTGLVSFGSAPPPVPDDAINYLRRHSEANPSPLAPIFEEGDWVRVAAGCFRGNEGRVLQFSPHTDRVCVLLSLLGHDVQISLPADQVIGREVGRTHVPASLCISPVAAVAMCG